MPEPVQGACCGGIEIGVRDGFPDAESFAELEQEAERWIPGRGIVCKAAEGSIEAGAERWIPGRWRGMPVLFWMFRFQNIRSPGHSARTVLAPDGQAVHSPSAKDRLPGWCPPCREAECPGFLIFFHSHIQNRTGIPRQLFLGTSLWIFKGSNLRNDRGIRAAVTRSKTNTGYSIKEQFERTISCIGFLNETAPFAYQDFYTG